MEELKECPFCGKNEAFVVPTDFDEDNNVAEESNFFINCDWCGSGGTLCASEEEAVKAWNTRTESAELEEWKSRYCRVSEEAMKLKEQRDEAVKHIEKLVHIADHHANCFNTRYCEEDLSEAEIFIESIKE